MKKHKVALIIGGVSVAAVTVLGIIMKSKNNISVTDFLESIDAQIEDPKEIFRNDILHMTEFNNGDRCVSLPDSTTDITFGAFVSELDKIKEVVGDEAKIDPYITMIFIN